MKELSQQDLEDIVNGATIMGSGGGGPVEIGERTVTELVEQGQPVRLVSHDEVEDDATMAVSAVIGSPDASVGHFDYTAAPRAFDLLHKHLEETTGRGLDYVLPGEVGAGNSLIPMTVAAQRRIGIIDAAGANRALPSLNQCAYAQLPMGTIFMANRHNKLDLATRTVVGAEQAIRGIIAGGTFHQFVGVAFWTMTGKQMKQAAVHGTTSRAMEIGAVLREARGPGRDPVGVVAKALGGKVLFSGKVTQVNQVTSGGFDIGSVVLTDQVRNEFWVYNQNENLFGYNAQDPQPLAMGPDLLSYLGQDGQVFSNVEIDSMLGQDKEVAIIASAAARELRTDAIVQAFLVAFRRLGYGGPYLPFNPLEHDQANA